MESQTESEEKPYIFYNSVRHLGCRLDAFELSLLDMLYIYRDKDYIISQVSDSSKALLSDIIDKLVNSGVLETKSSLESLSSFERTMPGLYYLHPTYRCNLSCTYCYNADVRQHSNSELPLESWCRIVDQIIPYAKTVVFTGGECFLYPDISRLIEYIRERSPRICIACISNCMHNFENEKLKESLRLLDNITFSCDSITREGERKGFSADRFRDNIDLLIKEYPRLHISISATETRENKLDVEEIKEFCFERGITFRGVIMSPSSPSEIPLTPCIDSLLVCETECEAEPLLPKRTRCGAALDVCSIDPMGNVYPCQALHFEEFRMGNILSQPLNSLRYLSDGESCLPSVDEIDSCNICKVKYICGGGCLATNYKLNGRQFGRNHLSCPLLKSIALGRLSRMQNQNSDKTK